MDLKVMALDAGHVDDFFRVHSEENGHGWCYCVAWWAPTWQGWMERTAEENRRMREQLFDVEQYDGYLMYDGDKPIGWCQVGPRDRLHKLVLEYKLARDSDAWAITCFIIIPKYREIGLGRYMLEQVLKDLQKKGVKYVQAFPRRGKDLAVEDLWTGPERFFEKAGFELERDDPKYPIYGKRF
nr:GNAT family N-acetyltransferase [candidate division Zixibacteria bacterium]